MGEPKPYHQISIHQALGGGVVADVLLWKKWRGGVVILVSTTVSWLLFERAGYNLLSFVANVLLMLAVILFLWAKSASLLNRPLPPLPDLEISEDSVVKAAEILQIWINRFLSIAHDIAIERDMMLCLKIATGLLVISFIGSLFNFLTLIYLCTLLSLSVPLLYDQYQDQIDDKLYMIYRKMPKQFGNVLGKIPITPKKEKKMQ